MKRLLTIACVLFALGYIFTGFIKMDFNPNSWNQDERSAYVFACFFGTLAIWWFSKVIEELY